MWGFGNLAFHWYRPWSREVHYWIVQRVFGADERAFHLVSLVLLMGILAAYWALVRRWSDQATATLAAAGVVLLSAWAVPVLWVAGVQDLWMLLLGVLSLLLFAYGHSAASALLFGLALLSKETAAVLPAIALGSSLIIERKDGLASLRRTTLHGIILVVWAAVHPLLGGRVLHPIPTGGPAAAHVPAPLLRTLASQINLEVWPAPASGWVFLARALPLIAVAAGLGAWATFSDRTRSDHSSSSRIAGFGITWALLGWLPLGFPGLGWHSYYALLGSLGAWMALAIGLVRIPALAIGVLGISALLHVAQSETPSRDWGSEWYQARAAAFIQYMRSDLKAKHPQLPPHSRLFFASVPSNVGFMTEGAPALRIWYGDPTLSGGFYRDYRPRPATPAGSDLFFRYDSTAGWIEIVRGDENLAAARAANPRWEQDHRELATVMARADDWRGAGLQYRKLAAADSLGGEDALNAGVCFEMVGDTVNARYWYGVAAARPRASEDTKQAALRFQRHLRAPP